MAPHDQQDWVTSCAGVDVAVWNEFAIYVFFYRDCVLPNLGAEAQTDSGRFTRRL